MRPRLSSGRALVVAATGALFALGELKAQSELATEGAAFLLIPVGARALGMGQALVADQPGTEAIWWNPAGVARAEKREVAIHHYDSFVGTGDAVSLLIPSSLLGVLTASVYILNYGAQEVTQGETGVRVGSVIPRNLVYAATYATPLGSRLSGGITFKVVQFRVDCTGVCEYSFVSTTSALDFGAQYDINGIAPLTFGVAIRNVGLRLQVNDRPQADPLPTRVQLGVLYRLTRIDRLVKGTEFRVAGDVLDEPSLRSPALRVGADVGWQKRVNLRAGYVFDNSRASGPSLGFGVALGSLRVDLARLFEGFSDSGTQPPTYVSLRYLF
jgi:hypothetical protein